MVIATTKLSATPYGQATVHTHDDGTVVLVSYTTCVAFIDPEGWLCITGLYSATTRKHLGAFVREYANIEYQTAKRIYEDGYSYNINTGEVARWGVIPPHFSLQRRRKWRCKVRPTIQPVQFLKPNFMQFNQSYFSQNA